MRIRAGEEQGGEKVGRTGILKTILIRSKNYLEESAIL
jgi:hypothetical protein